jgi:excisionase family DNA binding protein
MSRIPQSVLAAGTAMFSPYCPDLTPGKLEKFLTSKKKVDVDQPSLTTKEFCKLAKISRQTLWNKEKAGEISLIRFGRIVRVPRSEVERILSNTN